MDPRIKAIRANAHCTRINEAYTNFELIDALESVGAMTVESAVSWAVKTEGPVRRLARNKRKPK